MAWHTPRKEIKKVVRKDGYRVQDSGDPEAPYEIIDPDGRTVSIVERRSEVARIIMGDKAEKKHARRSK